MSGTSSSSGSVSVLPASEVFGTVLAGLEPTHLRNKLQSILLEHGAQTAVIENDYLDLDYSTSYYLHRGRSFTPGRRCTLRVHFFSAKFGVRRLEFLSRRTVNLLRKSYLGFTVLRPGAPKTVGRTFIRPPSKMETQLAFFPTKADFTFNLMGLPLGIKACPYISQDQVVMVCATAALWMSCTSQAAKMPDVAQHTTADITASALALSQPVGPGLVARGLSAPEMMRAFAFMGCDPRTAEYPDASHLLEACYIHVESGIPPVIMAWFPDQTFGNSRIQGYHTLTVVGHTIDLVQQRNTGLFTSQSGIVSAVDFVPDLVVHDDQNGMYLRMEVDDAEPGQKPHRARLKLHLDSGVHLVAYCHIVLMPLPRRVMLPGSVAVRQAANWLMFSRRNGWVPAGTLVLRAFLIRSNNLKELMLRRQGMPREVVDLYRALPMPRYVWLIEYARIDDWLNQTPESTMVSGEVILDSTVSTAEALDFLAVHLPGSVTVRRLKGDSMVTETYSTAAAAKYPPLRPDIRP